ncbi:hypothetical protein RJ639_027094 [Escallonia herrerae]|uniref:Translin-associated protein X n=1 Tax=Escallonia herrerae TaxID=1293975 RepID=A0AA89BQ22_9ASTE|nr:hypothetical protein RJ639_027094 [Escallonia herrerae]
MRHYYTVADTALQNAAKKPRTMSTESSMKDAFSNYAEYLNQLNDKRERVVKASRDVTFNSKKVIFQVHRWGLAVVAGGGGATVGTVVAWWVLDVRLFGCWVVVGVDGCGEGGGWRLRQVALVGHRGYGGGVVGVDGCGEGGDWQLWQVAVVGHRGYGGGVMGVAFWVLGSGRISKNNKDEVLGKAEKDLAAVTDQYMCRLVKELQGTDFWKLRRAYSPGVQEYVEAATFCNFCKSGTLLSLDEINAALLPLSDSAVEPLQINVLDYILGLADLTGELMRLAIGRISEGELEFAEKICCFARNIYRELTLLAPEMDDSSDMRTKMDTMLQSVMKIENACFSVHVRGSEYIPLLGSGDQSYPLLGMTDLD